jgi:hypothetical protein
MAKAACCRLDRHTVDHRAVAPEGFGILGDNGSL